MGKVTRRGFLKGIAGAGAAATVSGFPAFLKHGLGEKPVKWGSLHPLTGPVADLAADQKAGVEIAVEDVNAAGGVLGREVKVLFRDTELDPTATRRKAIELLDREKIDFMGGAASGIEELALNDISLKRRVLYFVYPQYMLDTKARFSKYTFTANVTPYQTAAAGARWAAANIKGKKWHLLADNYSWPKMFVPAYRNIAKETNSEFTGVTWAPFPTTDYSTYIPKVQAINPDVLFCITWGSGQINLIKQLQEFGVVKQMPILIAISDIPWFMGAGAGKFNGMYAGMTWWWRVGDKYPASKVFNDKFMKKRGRPSSAYGSSAYEIVRLALDTANEIKSLNHDKMSARLEGKRYKYLKSESWIRPCDHNNISEFFFMRGKPADKMENKWDFVDIVFSVHGEGITLSCKEKGLA